MSGGEQQMLAVARALMAEPRLLLLDEPSMGLAPLITAELFRQLSIVTRDTGTAMLLVEQNAAIALSIARRAYVLEAGEIVLQGAAEQLRGDDSIRRAYLGV
jgi:branched-chain amino acid transport system ATP-binding protein